MRFVWEDYQPPKRGSCTQIVWRALNNGRMHMYVERRLNVRLNMSRSKHSSRNHRASWIVQIPARTCILLFIHCGKHNHKHAHISTHAHTHSHTDKGFSVTKWIKTSRISLSCKTKHSAGLVFAVRIGNQFRAYSLMCNSEECQCVSHIISERIIFTLRILCCSFVATVQAGFFFVITSEKRRLCLGFCCCWRTVRLIGEAREL